MEWDEGKGKTNSVKEHAPTTAIALDANRDGRNFDISALESKRVYKWASRQHTGSNGRDTALLAETASAVTYERAVQQNGSRCGERAP